MKESSRWKIINPPSEYYEFFEDPSSIKKIISEKGPFNGYHVFVTSQQDLISCLNEIMLNFDDSSFIWISWPKKSSGITSDISEDFIRETALPVGLVDIKVCAVSAIWSGLKLVKRKIFRKKSFKMGE